MRIGLDTKTELLWWKYKALKLGIYAARLRGVSIGEDPELPTTPRQTEIEDYGLGELRQFVDQLGQLGSLSPETTTTDLTGRIARSISPGPKPSMTDQCLHPDAFSLYRPPFKHVRGFIFDSQNNMVADQTDHVLRVRGWGRISYLKDPEQLQDAVGDLIAEALTAYWVQHS
jgi:hypothetical protein